MIILPRISRKIKILIGAVLILLLLGFISLKTNFPKKLLKMINKDLIEENEALKKSNNDIQKGRVNDSTNYADALIKKEIQIEAIKFRYNNSLKTIRKYEQAINNYRVGEYIYNFRSFSKFVTSTDTLQVSRFNADN